MRQAGWLAGVGRGQGITTGTRSLHETSSTSCPHPPAPTHPAAPDYLVRKGVPFRETHHVAGAAVRLAETRGVPLSALTPADLRTLHPKFDDDVAAVWSFEHRCAEGEEWLGAGWWEWTEAAQLAAFLRLRVFLPHCTLCSVESRDAIGGTALSSVMRQVRGGEVPVVRHRHGPPLARTLTPPCRTLAPQVRDLDAWLATASAELHAGEGSSGGGGA